MLALTDHPSLTAAFRGTRRSGRVVYQVSRVCTGGAWEKKVRSHPTCTPPASRESLLQQLGVQTWGANDVALCTKNFRFYGQSRRRHPIASLAKMLHSVKTSMLFKPRLPRISTDWNMRDFSATAVSTRPIILWRD